MRRCRRVEGVSENEEGEKEEGRRRRRRSSCVGQPMKLISVFIFQKNYKYM